MVGVRRFELLTSSVSGKRSPPELNAQMERTTGLEPDPNLGKVVLYQLSHVRLRGLIIRDARILCKNFFEKFCDTLANLAKTSATTESAGQRKLAARGPLQLSEHDPGRAVLRKSAVCKW